MNELVLMVVALAVVMLIVIIYLAIKEKESARKMAMIETGIDMLNQELFKINKELESLEKRLKEEQKQGNEIDINLLNSFVDEKISPLMEQMENFEDRISFLSDNLAQNLEAIQAKIKQLTMPSEHVSSYDKQVLQLYSEGMDPESIAKQLRIGKGEVDLILRFSKLHV